MRPPGGMLAERRRGRDEYRCGLCRFWRCRAEKMQRTVTKTRSRGSRGSGEGPLRRKGAQRQKRQLLHFHSFSLQVGMIGRANEGTAGGVSEAYRHRFRFHLFELFRADVALYWQVVTARLQILA